MPSQTRLIRHEGEAGLLELVLWEPDVRLRADVLVLEDYEEGAAEPVRQRNLPAAFVPLIINFGAPYRLHDPADAPVPREYGSFAAGLRDSGVVTESPGTALCVQVNLTPLGAHRFLGVAMHELAGRVVSLSDVLGRAADGLEERLAKGPDATARLALVESLPVARLAAAAPAARRAVRLATARGDGRTSSHRRPRGRARLLPDAPRRPVPRARRSAAEGRGAAPPLQQGAATRRAGA